MLPEVFLAAITSAFLHAGWNAAAKKRERPGEAVIGVVLACAVICALLMPAIFLTVGLPPAPAWKWVLLAVPLSALGYTGLRIAYDKTEYGLAYPLARGIIPVCLAAFGWSAGDRLNSMQLLGMAGVLVGFVIFTFRAGQLGPKDIQGAIAAVISGLLLSGAVYCDIAGMRLTDYERTTGIEYVLVTTFFGCLFVIVVGELQTNRHLLRAAFHNDGYLYFACKCAAIGFGFQNAWTIVRNDLTFFMFAGLAATASFALALWAYAHGPIGLVAPLRETNILFAGLLAFLYLREAMTRIQWIAIAVTTLGAALLKLG